jgi:hypothetical protein
MIDHSSFSSSNFQSFKALLAVMASMATRYFQGEAKHIESGIPTSYNIPRKDVLWTYLDLQGKPHVLIPEPLSPHQCPSSNMRASTGHTARRPHASGMTGSAIVLLCGTFFLTFCVTYYCLLLTCLLFKEPAY